VVEQHCGPRGSGRLQCDGDHGRAQEYPPYHGSRALRARLRGRVSQASSFPWRVARRLRFAVVTGTPEEAPGRSRHLLRRREAGPPRRLAQGDRRGRGVTKGGLCDHSFRAQTDCGGPPIVPVGYASLRLRNSRERNDRRARFAVLWRPRLRRAAVVGHRHMRDRGYTPAAFRQRICYLRLRVTRTIRPCEP
jgi:hypothetical protein